MASNYKKIGSITSFTQREFNRWVIVYSDGTENCVSKKSLAVTAAKCHLAKGDDIHLYEETVVRSIKDKRFVSENSFRIEITDRIKNELLIEKII